jgi:alcohol dehydrogenase class IV
MVRPFRFARLPLIIFGAGKLSELPLIVKRSGTYVLLVTGKDSFMNSLRGKSFLTLLGDNKIRYNHVVISREPSPEMIDKTVALCRNDKPDVVLAIGGGSVIDAGKAISALIPVKGFVKDYLEGVGIQDHPGLKLPFIAVPTTSGTGSEVTKNAVISETGPDGFKRSLRHDNFVPDVALVDPELTLHCPKEITAASGMDCFTQLTEAYLSDKSNVYTDTLAIEGLRAIKSSLIKSYTNGEDIDARTGMSFAALTSGICLANAGLGVVHGFASSVGGLYNIPHGVICGTLMSISNEINVRELRRDFNNHAALQKYARLGELFLDEKGKSDNYYIDGFIRYLSEITSELKLPGLMNYGLEEKDIELICSKTEIKNNPVKLAVKDLTEILYNRM